MNNLQTGNRGMSMIAVLVAAAILSGLILVVTKMGDNSQKIVKSVDVNNRADDFRSVLKDLFSITDACTQSFGKVTAPTARSGFPFQDNVNTLSTLGIQDATGSTLYNVNDFPIEGFKLIKVEIRENLPDPSGGGGVIPNLRILDPAKNIGWFELRVMLEKNGAMAKTYGGKVKTLSFNILTKFYDDAGIRKIEWCQLSGANSVTDNGPGTGPGPASSYTGGQYLNLLNSGTWVCQIPNPVTGGCTCPTGYTSSMIWEFVNGGRVSGFYCYPSSSGACHAQLFLCSI